MQRLKIGASTFLGSKLRRLPLYYNRYRKFLTAAEEWDAAKREAWINRRLERTLDLARKTVGYRDNGSAAGLQSWPFLDKATIRGREAQFGQPGWPSYTASTGGTTGTPLVFKRSLPSIVMEQATLDHICARAGLDLAHARVAVLRGDHVKPPSDMSPPFWKRPTKNLAIFSAFHLAPSTIPAYAEALREYAPDIMMCYPSSLQHLTALFEQAGSAPRLKFVFCSSEYMPPDLMPRVRNVFGARMIDFYGQAERAVASYAIDNGGHTILPFYGFAEFIPDGNGRFQMVGTSFWNDRQIFVRYRTGDFALLPDADPQSLRDIALGLKPFAGIEGRAAEFIDLPDGKRIIGLNHIPRGVPDVASVQIAQVEPRTIEAYVVPLAGYGPASEAVLRQNFYAKFPQDIALRIVSIDAPLRTKAGKAPLLMKR